MPAILGFVAILFLVYFAVCMLIPTIASVMATMFIGKTAKLEFEEVFLLCIYFYLIQWALVGIVIIQENDPQTWWGAILYFMGGLFWPLPYTLMLFNPTDSGWGFALLGCSFVITQLIAVIMILKKARKRTNNL